MVRPKILILALALLVCLNSCKDDPASPGDNGNNGGKLPTASFTATLDGTAWTADTVWAEKYPIDTTRWVITGRKGMSFIGQDMDLVIPSKDPATYTVTSDIFETYITFSNTIQNIYASREGSVTVTESTDKYIKGSFAFKAHDNNGAVVHDITNGQFVAIIVN
jgi:hypothetical protein